jgi:type VI secretion system (T6SS) phospholipase Tle1-like effector
MALYAFDGTWNTKKENEDKTHFNTNVVKLHASYEKASGKKQYYVEGVGTRWDVLGAALGGVFGLGERPRLDEAYAQLCATWTAPGGGDQIIDIIGFSRGSATALDFCHRIQDDGIKDPRSNAVVEASPKIRFLGLWDVVASFGLANLGNAALNFGHTLEIPRKNIDYCFHAMALDERRPSFLPIRLRGACEVWFRGVHSDIGGGNGNTGLSDITLKWMMSKAKAAGVPIADADIPTWTAPVTATPKPDVKLPIPVRTVAPVDRKHYSVAPLDGWTDPPATCPPESAVDETTATKAGAVSVVSLPLEQRVKLASMAEAAHAQADALEMTLDPATYDQFMYLFETRLTLITTDEILKSGRHAARVLVDKAVSNARHAQFPTVAPVFLTQAIFQSPQLFPLTD